LTVALAGCGQPGNQVAPAAPAEESVAPGPDEQPSGAGPPAVKIANPASTNCIERGGKLEIQSGPGGQFGVCIFDDGSRCEEWALFRGECAPGDCTAPDGRCE